MTSEADPRGSWAFRRRVAAARVAGGLETIWSAMWPCLMVVGAFLVVSLLGVWSWLPAWLHALGLLGFFTALLWTVWQGRDAWRWPDQSAGLRRLEQVNHLAHQPLRALGDRLSGGAQDRATRALWSRHLERIREAVLGLRVGPPRSDLPRRDPWALRVGIALLLVVAVVEAGSMAPRRLVQAFELGRGAGDSSAPLETTVWITPPTYTGQAPRRLEVAAPAAAGEALAAPLEVIVPAGSEVLAQLHHFRGPVERFVLALDQDQKTFTTIGEGSAEATLTIARSGQLTISGPGDQLHVWTIEATPDTAPQIVWAEAPAATNRGVLRSHFRATDDYGLGSIALLLSRPRSGVEPQRIELMRPAGATTELDDSAYLDLTPHPWAGLPVIVRLEAVDALDQHGLSEPRELILPAREFQHEVARRLIEQRQRLAVMPEEREAVARALDQIARDPSRYQYDDAVYLALNSAATRLRAPEQPASAREERAPPGDEEAAAPDAEAATPGDDQGGEADREQMAANDQQAPNEDVLDLLWDTALHLEDGRLSLAERELRELQDALRQALEEGASDEELERLMSELQRALDEFLDAMIQQAQELGQQPPETMPIDPDAMQVERQDLQQMLDAIREMIRTGAREAAQQMLAQLQQMLENLQMAQNGQMQQGQQMMSQLQQMIQRQQDLLDQTFSMSRGQQGQQGEQGQQGQHGQQGQMGQQGQQGQMGQTGQRGQMGQPGQMGQQGGQMGQMATDQEALRRALGDLMAAIGEAGAQIPRALGEAELAMRAARDALQQGQAAQALDPEAQALDQLRQGGQAMMQEMQRMYGQGQGQMPGQQFGQAPNNRDPLGRSMYNQGGADLWGERIPTELDLGRARAILEELYRRAGQRNRPPLELDYLDRLLKRF